MTHAFRSALGDPNGFKGDSKKDVSGMSDLFADNPARRNSVSRKAPEAKKGVKKANESDVSDFGHSGLPSVRRKGNTTDGCRSKRVMLRLLRYYDT